MKLNPNKIYISVLFIILNLLITNRLLAANLSIDSSKDNVGIGEQFYVDLKLDPNGESFNAISGSISYDKEYLTFIRAEEAKSIVDLWVEKPKQESNTILFAGVISNGFDGVIDPFNSSYKMPGLIIRLVFEPKTEGQTKLLTSTFNLNLNDGKGTEVKIPPIDSLVNIDNFTRKIKYINGHDSAPELEAYIVRDSNIYDNRYVLVFKAIDKETGIINVKIKEGRRDWREITSPYLLVDQSRHSDITLQALNHSGSGVIINIDKIPYDWKDLAKIVIIVIIIIALVLLWIRKIYASKHKN